MPFGCIWVNLSQLESLSHRSTLEFLTSRPRVELLRWMPCPWPSLARKTFRPSSAFGYTAWVFQSPEVAKKTLSFFFPSFSAQKKENLKRMNRVSEGFPPPLATQKSLVEDVEDQPIRPGRSWRRCSKTTRWDFFGKNVTKASRRLGWRSDQRTKWVLGGVGGGGRRRTDLRKGKLEIRWGRAPKRGGGGKCRKIWCIFDANDANDARFLSWWCKWCTCFRKGAFANSGWKCYQNLYYLEGRWCKWCKYLEVAMCGWHRRGKGYLEWSRSNL